MSKNTKILLLTLCGVFLATGLILLIFYSRSSICGGLACISLGLGMIVLAIHNKYQYDETEIVTLGGFNISDFVEMTKSEALIIKRELIHLIEDEDFIEYSDFLIFVERNGTEEQFDIATSNTILFNNYLKSRRHRLRGTNTTIKVDPNTGEVIDN